MKASSEETSLARLLKGLFWALLLLYAVALFIFATGTFGWFGQERAPLSGVFLTPLGLPWVLFAEVLPDAIRAWFAALAPVINIALLWVLSQRVARRRH